MRAGASTSAAPIPMLNQPSARAAGAASPFFIARPTWRTTSSARSPASMMRVRVVSLIDIVLSLRSASRLHDDFDAAVLLIAKGLVELRPFLEVGAVRDDKGRIDLAFLDPLHQLWQVMLHRRLSHAEGQPPVHRRAHRDLVEKPAIDANDRDDAEIAAAMDRLAQDMRPVGAHKGCDLGTVPDGVEACQGFGLGADRVDASVGAAPLCQ